MAGKIFRNVTKAGFVRGTSILIILAGAEGPYATKWGIFGLHLKVLPSSCVHWRNPILFVADDLWLRSGAAN